MKRWDALVAEYLDELSVRGLMPETVIYRGRELERFGNWLKRRRPRVNLEQVGAEQLTQYIKDRGAFKAKATIAGIVSTLRGMGEYLVRREVWQANPLRWMRGPRIDWRRQAPRRINRPQMQALWQVAVADRSGYHRYLWVTMLGMLYGTGIRRGELARLDVTAWDEREGTVLVDGRKSGRQRLVRLPDLAARCLTAYVPQRQNLLAQLGREDEPALWLNQDGGRLTANGISRGIKRITRRAGLEVHMHQFRHSCASDLLEEGVRLPEIQRLLGHQTISTTVRYLQVADPQRHAAAALHPINQMLGLEGGAA